MGVQGGREDEGKKIISENLRKAQPNTQLHLPVRLITSEMQTVLLTKVYPSEKPLVELEFCTKPEPLKTPASGERGKKKKTLLLRRQHQCL